MTPKKPTIEGQIRTYDLDFTYAHRCTEHLRQVLGEEMEPVERMVFDSIRCAIYAALKEHQRILFRVLSREIAEALNVSWPPAPPSPSNN